MTGLGTLGVQVTWLVLAALYWMLTAGVGLATLRALRLRLAPSVTRLVLAVATGWTVAGLVLFGLGLAGLLSRELILVLTILTIPLAVHHAPWEDLGILRRFPQLPTAARTIAVGLAGVATITLLGALAPDVEFDSTWYHLPDAQRFLAEHAVRVHAQSIQDIAAFLPKLPELLFAWVLAPNPTSPTLAQLSHWLAGGLLAAGTYALARRVSQPTGALLATATVYLAHSVGWLSQTAYADLFVGLFAVSIALALLKASDSSHGRNMIGLAGLLTGALLLSKLQAIFFLPAIALGAFAARQRWQDVVVVLGLGLLVVAPWYILVWTTTGSPLGLAGYWPPGDVHYGGGANFLDWLIRIHPTVFASRLVQVLLETSPLLVLSVLPLLAWKQLSPTARWLIVIGLVTQLGWTYNPVPVDRYGLPALPLLAAGVATLYTIGNRVIRATLLLGLLVLAVPRASLIVQAAHDRFPVALGAESRTAYLDRQLHDNLWIYWDTEQRVPKILGNGTALLLTHNSFYVNVRSIDLIQFAHEALGESATVNEVLAAFAEAKITHLVHTRPFTLESFLGELPLSAADQVTLRTHLRLVYQSPNHLTVWELVP
ncbi:hypothetical protein HY375_00290 [Candidatus Berkelbacteria bacterium]|nr:hypothetical protein [Candidatus Berkelbacteria bacterium]